MAALFIQNSLTLETYSFILFEPSKRLYSVWTCRCVNDMLCFLRILLYRLPDKYSIFFAHLIQSHTIFSLCLSDCRVCLCILCRHFVYGIIFLYQNQRRDTFDSNRTFRRSKRSASCLFTIDTDIPCPGR